LIQKMKCQLASWMTAPPTSGPSATPSPLMPDQTPIALIAGEGVGQQRQGQRSGDRGAHALDRAGGDEQSGRGCQGRARGGEREDGDAHHEHPSAAEAVAEGGAGEQEHREGQGVGVDGPLEVLDRAAEARVNARQGDRDHEVVQHGHEQTDRDDDEDPDASARLRHERDLRGREKISDC
jgi:hypothetical protein